MGRLRTILLLRAALAVFFLGLGVVLLADDAIVFGVFAIVVAVVNGALIFVLARRTRRAP